MDFDLDPSSYEKSELIRMFELSSQQYDLSELEKNENRIINKINDNKDIDGEMKNKIIRFIKKAKKKLVSGAGKRDNNGYKYNFKPVETVENHNDEHFVQEREKIPFVYSYPTDVVTGVINPLKKRTIKKFLNIDTRFRSDYSGTLSSDFRLQLPIRLNSVINMRLTAFEQPTTYYVISCKLGNNFFYMSVPEHNEFLMITIPDGNYLPCSLIEGINNLIAYSASSTVYLKHILFSINISPCSNSGSGTCTVSINPDYLSAGGESFTIGLDFGCDKTGVPDTTTNLQIKFGWGLGFRFGDYFGQSCYTSEGIVDITGSRYLYLVVDDFNNSVTNNFYSAFDSWALNKNVLARINVNTGLYNVISQNNLNLITAPREYFGPVNIQRLQIQLLDEYGRIVDLNSMDYSFCLSFDCVYDV